MNYFIMFQKKNVMLPAFHRLRLGLELVLDFNRGVWGGGSPPSASCCYTLFIEYAVMK